MNLLPNNFTICISGYVYASGWDSYLPDMEGDTLHIMITNWDEPIEIDIDCPDYLDDLVNAVVTEIRRLQNEEDSRADYFEDHIWIERLELDPEAMTVKVFFGS